MSVIFDHDRAQRIGLPESVFCAGKSLEALSGLICDHAQAGRPPMLFTRLSLEVHARLDPVLASKLDYHALSQTAVTGKLSSPIQGRVGLVSAGTSDGPVLWEAARTLEYLGISHTVFEDMGVAGLWRLTSRIEQINAHQALIVTAGMDAALVSVLGGLTPLPVVAVPTSVGYGAAQGGQAALWSMLASCAPGICVMNIDNGYGAACACARILGRVNG